MMKNIALFGGSFDPPHLGHIHILKEVLKTEKFDHIWVLPTAFPIHKQEQRLLPFSLRFKLSELAFKIDERIEIKDLEYFLEAPTRTYFTLKHLMKEHPAQYTIILGEDEFRYFESWYAYQELAKLCSFLVVQRPHAVAQTEKQKPLDKEVQSRSLESLQEDYAQKYGLKSQFLFFEPLAIASRKIRPVLEKAFIDTQVDNHLALQDLKHLTADEKQLLKNSLSESVLQYLLDTRLYGLYRNIKHTLSESEYLQYLTYDKIAYEHEGLKRCVHSQHVALLAYHYALKHQLSDRDYSSVSILFSAVLHDIAKYFTQEQCFSYLEKEQLQDLAFPLWHAPVGAIYLKTKKIYTDALGLQAIRYHATLEEGANLWEQLLFLADKIEYSRPYKDLAPLRALLNVSVSQACLFCLYTISRLLEAQGAKMDSTKRAILYLENLKE